MSLILLTIGVWGAIIMLYNYVYKENFTMETEKKSKELSIQDIMYVLLDHKKLIIISSHYLERYNMLQCNVIKL